MEIRRRRYLGAAIAVATLCIAAPILAATLDTSEEGWALPARHLPPPAGASEALREIIRSAPQPSIDEVLAATPKDAAGWKALRETNDAPVRANAPKLAQQLGVTVKEETIEGVHVYRLTPKRVAPAHEGQVFFHIHGGAYVLNGGPAATPEAILIAARTGIAVISVDYRMPPDHPFPAALEDVTKVYRALLTSHSPQSIAIGGTSAGAGLSLAAMLHFKALKLPLPAAAFLGTPWSDLTRTGDSFFLNEGADRTLVTYRGVLAAAAKLYADGRDLKNPLLSPLYGDFTGLPPAMLVTGTRDLFLSLTARTHRRLRDAGVPAEIHVFEGLSHGEYIALRDTPESRAVYTELSAFLRRWLK